MDIKDLKVLIKIVTETDINEFELENADEKIVIRRGVKSEVVHYQHAPQQAPVHYAAHPQQSAPITQTAQDSVPVTATAKESGNTINSPIVGTFYRAPAPDAAPYVEVGQIVEKGQVLCIVEAMKLMNEIDAEYRCKIIKICKDNAQPVEFGDPLFVVEPL
jgi:acetyl-CoA carboxylase biotin carboxyl carrier protein